MDADSLVFLNIYSDFSRAVKDIGADAVFAAEGGINAGCYWATPAALPLFQAWVRSDPERIDQDALNELAYVAFAFCTERDGCGRARKRGFVPVWRHPTFFPRRTVDDIRLDDDELLDNGACIRTRVLLGPPEPLPGLGHCEPRLAYLHVLCITGDANKAMVLETLGLWLVDEDGRVNESSAVLRPCPEAGLERRWDYCL